MESPETARSDRSRRGWAVPPGLYRWFIAIVGGILVLDGLLLYLGLFQELYFGGLPWPNVGGTQDAHLVAHLFATLGCAFLAWGSGLLYTSLGTLYNYPLVMGSFLGFALLAVMRFFVAFDQPLWDLFGAAILVEAVLFSLFSLGFLLLRPRKH